MMRKRTYAQRARSVSKKRATKKQRFSSVVPRFRTLANPNLSARSQYTRTTLIYNEWGASINPGIAVAGVYLFAVNGLFDPNITAVGHQCAGFDQYMALYNEYLVVGSTIKVWFTNQTAGATYNVGIFLEDFNTTDLSWSRYIENGNGVWSQLTGLNDQGVKCLKHKADISKFSTQDITNDDGFVGTASKNPDDTHFYHIVVAPADASSDLAAVTINVEIRYDVMFRDPALTALS